MKKWLILAVIFCLMAVSVCGCQKAEATGTPQEEGQTVDVDLTKLSSTVVYAEVYNMMVKPEEYMGKVIKMTGLYTMYRDESSGLVYYACRIEDALACCAQGIEFVLAPGYEYPTELGSEITVIGTFDTYTEGTTRYCTLRDSVLE